MDYREDLYNFFLIFDTPSIGTPLFPSILEKLNETIAAEITRQILSTLVYLHSKNITYGSNLSLLSIVLEVDSTLDENLNIKVKDLDIEIAKRISGIQTSNGFNNNKASDIKQVGIMLKIMLTGDHMEGGLKDEISSNAQEFVKKMLESD